MTLIIRLAGVVISNSIILSRTSARNPEFSESRRHTFFVPCRFFPAKSQAAARLLLIAGGRHVEADFLEEEKKRIAMCNNDNNLL